MMSRINNLTVLNYSNSQYSISWYDVNKNEHKTIIRDKSEFKVLDIPEVVRYLKKNNFID